MTDRNERSDRLRKRFDRDTDEQHTSEGDAESDTETAAADGTSVAEPADSTSVKDRPSVLMYLPRETRSELDIRFDELNARHKREHGEALEKNRDYYPAVIKAGLEGQDIKEILDL